MVRYAVHFRQWAGDHVGFEVCGTDESSHGLFEYDAAGGQKAQLAALKEAAAVADRLDRAEARKAYARRYQ